MPESRGNVVDVAGIVGSKVKNHWSFLNNHLQNMQGKGVSSLLLPRLEFYSSRVFYKQKRKIKVEEEYNKEVDSSTPISLDDGLPVDLSGIGVVQCLIKHHKEIFIDANGTVWR